MGTEKLFYPRDIKLGELLGNGKKYVVPPFQRDYSWTQENWEDLYNDIIDLSKDGRPHFMGTIVLQTTENENQYIVVDGQQRIATISLFALAVIRVLKDLVESGVDTDENSERVRILTDTMIGRKDVTSLHYQSKLKLNTNNDLFYQSKILMFEKPVSFNKLTYSEKLIYDAYRYFYEELRKKYKNDKGVKIAKFLEEVVSVKLLFIEILVENELSAYTVFETLNARGVELTTTDLMKNYLFSLVANQSSDFEIAKESWKNIIDIIGIKKFPVFLRYYINSRFEFVRKDKLFKRIKSIVNTGKEVFNLLIQLEKVAYLYNALKNPDDDFWNDCGNQKEIVRYLNELKLFKVTQPILLLLAAYDKFSPEEFLNLLRVCSVISFRYNVIGKLNPNVLEKSYNKAAIAVFAGNITMARDAFNDLKQIYINDESFVNMFSTKTLNTKSSKKMVKYILCHLEQQVASSEIMPDYNNSKITIEHILPEKAEDRWNEFFTDEDKTNYTYRIGNLTLLEHKKNREAANKGFTEKSEIYETSKFKMTQDIKFDEWDVSTLRNRQQLLAQIAKAIWKIDY